METKALHAFWKSLFSPNLYGGRIVLQLWHTGRASHPDFQPGGVLPVSASAIAINGYSHTPKGKKPYVVPRPLELDEIPGVVQQYANPTKCWIS